MGVDEDDAENGDSTQIVKMPADCRHLRQSVAA
jgi:hypothetical protein